MGTSPQPAKRGPFAHDHVYATLKAAILGGFFRPGDRITIRSLSRQLDTSDTPVREALKRLVAERAIATIEHSFAVPVLSREQVDQVLELRILLEGLAAAQAAEAITELELDGIRKEFGTMNEAVKRLDIKLLLKSNTRFHFLIYRASRNEVLLTLLESLWLQYAPTLSEYAPKLINRLSPQAQKKLYIVAQEQHQYILAALEARDAVAVRERIHADLMIFRDAAQKIGQHIAAVQDNRGTVADYADLLPGR